MELEQPKQLDILDVKTPALSSTNDMPVVETKPDASNQGKPPETASATEVDETEDTTVQASEPEQKPADPAATAETKKSKGVQKRIDELTREREEARRLAEAERVEKQRLLALLEERSRPQPEPVKPEVKTVDEPVRPNRTEFADPDAYEQALDQYYDQRSEWRANQVLSKAREEDRKIAETRAIEEGQRLAREAYSARVEKAKEKYSDYKDVAESPNVTVSVPMAHAILHSEHGPDIAYHLGKNPAEAQRIASLPPPLQLVELGQIVARINMSTPAPSVSTPPLTKAPKPIKPLGAGSESSDKPLEDLSPEEYAARWRERPENKRRPGMRQ